MSDSVFNLSTIHPFDRCGIAAISELETPEWKELFLLLEQGQVAFLERESIFRSREYRWPRDPLHTFSRVWEYPYVYHHLERLAGTAPKESKLVVADIGSAVTFFPFSVAKLGFQVVCIDIDPICKRDLMKACAVVPHSPGAVDFKLSENGRIPIGDSECDAVYCISVLEHISDFERTVAEIARILKPGGLCLITCDINLHPADGLPMDDVQFARLATTIETAFVRLWPERTVHPVNVLTSRNSLYPLKGERFEMTRTICSLIKQRLLKPILGREPGRVYNSPPTVSVYGLALKKRF